MNFKLLTLILFFSKFEIPSCGCGLSIKCGQLMIPESAFTVTVILLTFCNTAQLASIIFQVTSIKITREFSKCLPSYNKIA